MAAQATSDERRALADEVIDNEGGLGDLDRAVGALWDRLVAA